MYVPARSPATSKPLQKVTAARLAKAARVRKGEEILEKLQDLRSVLPLAKIRDGSASFVDDAIRHLADYVEITKRGER